MEEAFKNELLVTGDPLNDARAVRDLCYYRAAQQLNLSSGGLSLQLRVLDADTIKSCLVTLVSTIETQSHHMETVETTIASLRSELLGLRGETSEDDQLAGLRHAVSSLQASLTNLAQNVQGFTEDDAEPEPYDDDHGNPFAEAFAEAVTPPLAPSPAPPELQEENDDEHAPIPAAAASAAAPAPGMDLSEAKRLWRKVIREVMRNNRQKHNAVGVLKSRALRGQSIADRIKRLEDKMFDEFKAVHERLEAQAATRDRAIAAFARRLEALEDRLDGRLNRERLAILHAKLAAERQAVEDMCEDIKEATDRLRSEDPDASIDQDIALRERRAAITARVSELAVLRQAVDEIDVDDADDETRRSAAAAAALGARVAALHSQARDSLREGDDVMREIWAKRLSAESSSLEPPAAPRSIVVENNTAPSEEVQRYLESLQQEVQRMGDDAAKSASELEARVAGIRHELEALREREAREEKRLDRVERAVDGLDRRFRIQVERLVKGLEKKQDPSLAAAAEDVAEIRDGLQAMVLAQAKEINALFSRKADRHAVEAGLDAKADKADTLAATKELEDLLAALRSDVVALRVKSDRDLKLLKRHLEDLVAEAMAGRDDPDASAATTTCLTCAREVPETTRDVETSSRHRKLLPRLGLDADIHSPGSLVADNKPDDVYRAGFRMPSTRPGTAPGSGSRPSAEGARPTVKVNLVQPQGVLTAAESSGCATVLDGYAPPPGHHSRAWEGKVVRTMLERPKSSDLTRRSKVAAVIAAAADSNNLTKVLETSQSAAALPSSRANNFQCIKLQ